MRLSWQEEQGLLGHGKTGGAAQQWVTTALLAQRLPATLLMDFAFVEHTTLSPWQEHHCAQTRLLPRKPTHFCTH